MKINFGSKSTLSWLFGLMFAIAASLTTTSCIMEPEGDCDVRYQVEIRFTYNLMEVDAFASKVPSVTLFVFDKSGNLVTSKSESGEALQREHYTMQIDVEPGTYDLVAWCGLENNDNFTLNRGKDPVTIDDLKVRLERDYRGDEIRSAKQLKPVFHDIKRDVVFPDYTQQLGDVKVATMDLIKDTNTIRIILTHYNGEKIDPEDFSFSITDNNGWMDFDNSLLDDDVITYREWDKRDMPTVETDEMPDSGVEITDVNTMIAEIDVARLLTSQNPRLTIRAKGRDDAVLSLPIIQLLLHAKGEARRKMPDQEYLDRQDEYHMMFFLNGDNSWYTSLGIYINGWHMRYQETEI